MDKWKNLKKQEEDMVKILKDKRVYPVYQPIISLTDASVYGYEALTRIDMEECSLNIEELFQIAKRKNYLWELEALTRRNAMKRIGGELHGEKLFLNVDPDVIHDRKFRKGFTAKYIEKYGLDASKIVFEVTERTTIQDGKAFKKTIQHYKQQNYEIAVDDFGAEYAGMLRLHLLTPHFIKVDMQLIRGIDRDRVKQSLVRSLSIFGKNSGIALIAEGIETREELDTLVNLEIDYGQGYYLARPSRELWTGQGELKKELKELHRKAVYIKGGRLFQYIAEHSDETKLTITDEQGTVVDCLTTGDMKKILGMR